MTDCEKNIGPWEDKAVDLRRLVRACKFKGFSFLHSLALRCQKLCRRHMSTTNEARIRGEHPLWFLPAQVKMCHPHLESERDRKTWLQCQNELPESILPYLRKAIEGDLESIRRLPDLFLFDTNKHDDSILKKIQFLKYRDSEETVHARRIGELPLPFPYGDEGKNALNYHYSRFSRFSFFSANAPVLPR